MKRVKHAMYLEQAKNARLAHKLEGYIKVFRVKMMYEAQQRSVKKDVV